MSFLSRQAALLFIVGSASAFAGEFSVLGPVESIDRNAGSVIVLGESFTLNTDVVSVGDYVEITGIETSKGSVFVSSFSNFGGGYSPGSDVVALHGSVSANLRSEGVLVVGSAKIDYTALQSFADFSAVEPGDQVALQGVQPVSSGIVLATEGETSRSNDGGMLQSVTRTSGFGSGVSRESGFGSGVSRQAGFGSGVSRESGFGSGVSVLSGFGSGVSNN